ncbi:hypothetical protein ACIBSW_18995 [Actinoplanes sp. NPDC049668]|uniref:hypothetical protein n=1 Tax=unclassified Actinoplanes TaxID=2626549 RepID=UPI0033A30DEE
MINIAREKRAGAVTAIEFVQALVDRFPVLRPDLEAHMVNWGLSPHVWFGVGEGFTDRIVEAYLRDGEDDLDWRGVLDYFDERFDRGDREVDEVLLGEFLYRLPWPGQPGYGLTGRLPERLRARFDLMRPLG